MKNNSTQPISDDNGIKDFSDIKRWQIYKILWPPVNDQRFTRAAAMEGFVGALLPAIISSLAVILGLVGSIFQIDNIKFNISYLLPTTIWITISLGIYRMSRAAAIAGLVYSLVGLITNWPDRKIVNLVMVYMFINSVRATFAYCKIMRRV